MEDFQYPGQFEVDGVVYESFVCPESLPRVKNELKLDSSDIVLVTYPRSGTHWISEIVYNLDVGPGKARSDKACLDDFVSYVEIAGINENQKSTLDELQERPKPWRMRTHLPVTYYEHFFKQADGPKFIFMLRNPKDVLVSYYHIHKDLPTIGEIPWPDFWEMFKKKRLFYGDIFDQHLGWWKYHDHPNLLFIHYEDLLSDPTKELSRIAKYLGHSYSDEDIQAIISNTSFAKMAARPNSEYSRHFSKEELNQTGALLRKGKKGGWKEKFSPEQNAYIDSILETRTNPVGLHYRF